MIGGRKRWEAEVERKRCGEREVGRGRGGVTRGGIERGIIGKGAWGMGHGEGLTGG